jgi:hypothetical protein
MLYRKDNVQRGMLAAAIGKDHHRNLDRFLRDAEFKVTDSPSRLKPTEAALL